MQITLLPPLLPSEGVTPIPGTSHAFTPGARMVATVVGAALQGGTLLSMGGRDVSTGGRLPYPPGTTLRLEVVQGGPQPQLRLVSVEQVSSADPRPSTGVEMPPGPPVSAVTYGLAAAVLAASDGADVRGAATTVARWVPALVSSGVLTQAQGAALLGALAPVPVHTGPAATPEGARAAEAVARAIAARVAEGGLLLERRLADLVRQARPEARAAAANDLRSRLAVAAHLLGHAGPALEGARAAVAGLQEALLAEQARTAAHLARDGVVDIRVPLQVQGQDAEMRLRMRVQRDAPELVADDEPAPWRQVRLDLTVEGLGRVQVRLGVMASEVRAEFLVEHAAAADLIEAGLGDLGTTLEGAGFAQVLSRVVVDPVRVCAPDDLPTLPLNRTIVDAQA